jgi:predicted porin
MHSFRALLALPALAAILAAASPARAEIELFSKDGWSVSTNGRANGFYSYEFGDYEPTGGNPGMGGTVSTPFQAAPDDAAKTKFSVSRVHTGFVGSILGFTVRKEISPTLRASAHMELWWPIETDQFRGYSSMVPDPRESYVKLEGRWGAIQAGRALGLHDRGATITDFLYANGYSIGGPCNAILQGPLCGNIGYGYQFPGYNASISYSTPKAAGFQLTVGAFDPAKVGYGGNEMLRLALPRVESEATFDYVGNGFSLSAYVNGMWQQAGTDDATGQPKKVQAYGVGYGARVEAAGFKLGVGGNSDRGGGDFSALVGPVPLDSALQLRHTDGYFGQAMYSIGPVDIAAGAGITRILETVDDVDSEKSVIKTRLGMNLTFNYHVDPVVFNAQLFRAKHDYWRGERQTLTFLHTGMTFVW